jgi:UDP-N-acetyl-D-galactosamine dehydrogenase
MKDSELNSAEACPPNSDSGACSSASPCVCVVGLGYVGLPLAQAFSKTCRVIGFDTDSRKVECLARMNQNDDSANLSLSDNAEEISQADFVMICVPTPVTKSKEPDLSYVMGAARTVGRHMKRGSTVILESTVYPGVTEEVVKPVLEESGLRCGVDFKVAYSPERVNPGDDEHTIDKITKVVAGMDEETTDKVAGLYERISARVFKAKDIKTAEAAKVIENIQRDLNIALMNELTLIFDKMGLSTQDVLSGAATKWNFHRYSPGLVGGHCIPVDPYYLVYKAEELGYHSRVILAGRAINDYMPKHVAGMAIKALNSVGKVIKGSRVLIMGLTYKENVADTRETPVTEIIRELWEYGVEVLGCDPLLGDGEKEFGIEVVNNPIQASSVDCVIRAVGHDAFREISLDELRSVVNSDPVLIDVRGFFDRAECESKGFCYRSL